MILAAIDIGTNSTRLLISNAAFFSNKELIFSNKKPILIPLVREMHITRLGKNINGEISLDSADNTIKVLKRYIKLMSIHNVQKFKVVGTKVLRDAKNTQWFIDKVFNELGIKIEVISWQQEAKLSFLGAYSGLFLLNNSNINGGGIANSIANNTTDNITLNKAKNDFVLVFDIGGGSTEFIVGNLKGEIFYLNSISIGSVTVSELFLNERIPKINDLEKMSKYIIDNIIMELKAILKLNFDRTTKMVNSLNPKAFLNQEKCIARIDKCVSNIENINYAKDFKLVVGLAGTVSTLASVDLGLKKYCRDKIHGHQLNYERIIDIQKNFCSMDLEQRKKIIGLDKNRADIIIGGTEILIKILEALNIKKIFVSENDILYGIIYSIL